MESHPLIYIRTDGNEITGTAHLMRCLCIARALRSRDALPVFIVSDNTSIILLQGLLSPEEAEEHAYPVVHLQTDYRDLEREIPVMQRLLSSRSVTCCLIDSCFVTPRYLSALKQTARTAYLDDLHSFDYPVNLLINYEIKAREISCENAERVLSGAVYAPLREQFSMQAYHVWNEVKDILLYTGGTDPFGISLGLVNRLLKEPGFQDTCFHILTGPLSVHHAELLHLSRQNPGVQLHENVTDMAGLMADCDLAVAAGGSILYELCAVGIPSVSYSLADSQLSCVMDFDEAGLIPFLGDIRDNPAFYDTASAMLLALSLDPDARRRQSTLMRMTVDGAGAVRIAAALAERPAG